MSYRSSAAASVTLVGGTLLHAFTHAYACMLVPLYLLMAVNLHLPGVREASLIVSVYGMTYCLGSYAAGVLADRFSRRDLLGLGLAANAVVAICIGLTHRYELLLMLGVLGGLAGTLFHPAAGALVTAHYPRSPGMAVGLLGIGSGLGFFLGPQYAGWRAQSAHWHFDHVAAWQRPCIEMGAAGLVVALLFFLFAREADHGQPKRRTPMGRRLSLGVSFVAAVIGLRDFVGVALLSLGSIYLQKALAKTPAQTGLILGLMTALSIFINPLLVLFSPRGRRLPALAAVLILLAFVTPLVPLGAHRWSVFTICAAQTLQMGSYAISDAAILERVPNPLRGRVYGLFLTIAGTMSNTSPWIMGAWTDHFGPAASRQISYLPIFATLGLLAAISSLSVPLIARLGDVTGPAIEPFSEVVPTTLEPAL
jgi:MFS family permease